MRKFEGMNYLKSLVILTVVAGTLVACKKKEEESDCDIAPTPTLKVDVLPQYGSNTLYLDSIYDTQEGYRVKFTDIKFYLENVRSGSNQLIDAGLFDYRERGTLLLSAQGSPENFPTLEGNMGVDASINHDDPSAFPNDSWLNISNSNDMHWGWNPGYIFVKVEGKVDTIPDATDLLDHNMVFHVGLDVNMRTLSISNVQWSNQGNDLHSYALKLDMQEFLNGTISGDPIDLKTEYTSHSAAGQEAITTNLANNFRDALGPF